jgi:hypothetical protein
VATPYIAPMPPNTALTNGCTVQFVAIDPVSGDAVSGVTISNASIYVAGSVPDTELASGPFMLVPGPEA